MNQGVFTDPVKDNHCIIQGVTYYSKKPCNKCLINTHIKGCDVAKDGKYPQNDDHVMHQSNYSSCRVVPPFEPDKQINKDHKDCDLKCVQYVHNIVLYL